MTLLKYHMAKLNYFCGKIGNRFMSNFFKVSNRMTIKKKQFKPSVDGLLNGPDWSYLDGRPTPLNLGQYKRRLDEIQLAREIVKLDSEISTAIEMHDEHTQNIEDQRKYIKNRKLKLKGVLKLLREVGDIAVKAFRDPRILELLREVDGPWQEEDSEDEYDQLWETAICPYEDRPTHSDICGNDESDKVLDPVQVPEEPVEEEKVALVGAVDVKEITLPVDSREGDDAQGPSDIKDVKLAKDFSLDAICDTLEIVGVDKDLIRLDNWILFVGPEMETKATSFIHDLISPAFQSHRLDIANMPLTVIIRNYGELLSLIESYISDMCQRFQLAMVILPKAKSQTLFSQIKSTCNNYAVPSQLMIHSTLTTPNLPLYRIISALKEKASIKGYNNSCEILGDNVSGISQRNLTSKLFEGRIEKPHKPRYLSEGGTIKIKGDLRFENNPNKIIEYERISIVNCPTFFKDDSVIFNIEMSTAKNYFRITNLKLDPKSLADFTVQNALKRRKGRVLEYRYSTSNGKIGDEETHEAIAFRTDEFLDKISNNLSIGDLLEYSLLPMDNYQRAIRIIKIN